MSIVLKDGTVLPDIPAGVKEQYSFLTVVYMHSNIGTENESQNYHLIGSKAEWMHYPDALSGIGYDCAITTITPCVNYYCTADNTTSWFSGSEVDEGFLMLGATGIHDNTIVWANYDIKSIDAINSTDNTFVMGEVYFASCVFILPDGTELPALPAGCFEKYPYGAISKNLMDATETYTLYVFANEALYVPSELTETDFASIFHGLNVEMYGCSPDQTTWEQQEVGENVSGYLEGSIPEFGITVTTVWSNHDIFTAISFSSDIDVEPEIGTTLYRKSDVNYRIYGGLMNSLTNEARRLGGVTGSMKPDAMETVFKGVTAGGSGGGMTVVSVATGKILELVKGQANSTINMRKITLESSATGELI